MNMLESSECQQFLGMSKRSFCITLSIVLLGLLVGVFIEIFQWLSVVDFFKGSSLLKIGREYQPAISWIQFCAYAGMLAGMAYGFTKWLRYEVNPHRGTENGDGG
jgi:hypothetical protein